MKHFLQNVIHIIKLFWDWINNQQSLLDATTCDTSCHIVYWMRLHDFTLLNRTFKMLQPTLSTHQLIDLFRSMQLKSLTTQTWIQFPSHTLFNFHLRRNFGGRAAPPALRTRSCNRRSIAATKNEKAPDLLRRQFSKIKKWWWYFLWTWLKLV